VFFYISRGDFLPRPLPLFSGNFDDINIYFGLLTVFNIMPLFILLSTVNATLSVYRFGMISLNREFPVFHFLFLYLPVKTFLRGQLSV